VKVFLTIASGLVILLAGGCAVMITRDMPSVGLPLAGIAALNGLMLAAMYGNLNSRIPFYLLGVADIIIALNIAAFAIPFFGDSEGLAVIPATFAIAALVLAKGIFSFIYAKSL
jgi:hypothetical protein